MTTRGKRDAARAVIDSGIDPNARKRAGDAESAKTADTFEVIAREWYDSKTPTWAPMHAKRVMERLEADIFKFLGSMPIEKVEAPQLLTALRRVEDRGAVETAHRLRRTCGPDIPVRHCHRASQAKSGKRS